MAQSQDPEATETFVLPGTVVGPYEILGPIGAGGMGEVFRARDTRLGRPVALKFLSAATAADRAALDRFRREAQAISALNHPNVCTIYDIGEQDGRPYLVMELLEGQTLKQRIASGRFTIGQIVETAIPILEALEAAHSAGIVHRDIKPANLFVTKQGVVKILDFGLAKTSGLSEEAGEESLTVPGTTLGTIAYMSPEQARGEAVDRRSDLFSFGVVMYEMATGAKPFEGSWASTIDALLNRTPDSPVSRNPDLLPEIGSIIERTMEKDPAARPQTAASVRAELVKIKQGLDASAPTPRRTPAILTYAASAVAVLLAAGLVWFLRTPRGPVTLPSEFVQLTNFSDYATAPAVSPDGKMLAFFRGSGVFLNTGEIYIKILPDGESKQLTNDPEAKYDPVFTPGGDQVAYTVQGNATRTWDTFTVPVLGGTPTRLMPNAAGLSWFGPDHHIIFSEVMAGTALHMGIVTSQESRAEKHEIYFPPHERAMAHYSWPSPDQRSILIAEMDRVQVFQRCRVVPMQGGSAGVQVGPKGSCIAAQWSPDGNWMYFNVEIDGSTHLWRQRAPNGVPEQITFGPTEEEGLAVEPGGKSLITSIGVRRSSVGIHDSSGDHTVSVEGSVFSPRLSLDAKRLYYLARKSSSPDAIELWSRDLASGKSDPVVSGQHITDYSISPDQLHVAYSVLAGGVSQIMLYALDRSSSPRPVTKDGDRVCFLGNDALIFRQLGDKANYLARIQTDGSGSKHILDLPVAGTSTGVSPDGDWAVAGGTIDPKLPPGTFAISLKDFSHRRLCAGACIVDWSPDGKYLYVTVNSSLLTSSGRTLVVPLPRGLGQTPLPAGGFDGEETPGSQLIRQKIMTPGPDPSTYAFTTAEFQGNLFRVPLH